MVEKITCPECNAEFDLGEGYKKHLEDLKAKTRAEVEKKTKDSTKREIQENKKKATEWAEETIKAEKEKKNEIQKELQAEKQKNKQADKKNKEHYAGLAHSKIKAAKEDLEQKSAEKDKLTTLKVERLEKQLSEALKTNKQGVTVDQGSIQVMQLIEFLREKVFKNNEDKFIFYGAGEEGGDVLQEVIEKGEPICKILYESKKTKGWSSKWLDKLQQDMTDSKAIVGILFSVTVPKSFNKDDLYQHTGNIFVCRYDYIILKILAQTQRHLLTQLHKERGNGKENALSAIKFFDNPDVKNIITQMIVKHSAVKNKIKKTIKLAQETEETVDDVSLNYDELFNQMKNIGIDYFSQKKAEEDEK